jgi:7-cyano-7-deazaguanine synthase in queuosine biosynthesis
MLQQRDTLSWFQANNTKLLSINAVSKEAVNTNFIVFGLTRDQTHDLPHLTQEHITNYTTNAVLCEHLQCKYKNLLH